MQITEIKFLEKFKLFEKGEVVEFSGKNITVLAGLNGTGKTTLLSVINQFFYNLERYYGKYNIELCITYYTTDNAGNKTFAEIKCEQGVYYFRRNKSAFKPVIPRKEGDLVDYRPIREKYDWSKAEIEENCLHMKEIVPFLPTKICGSVFSVHSEFSYKRNKAYQGALKELMQLSSIEDILGNNHYSIGNLTNGLLRVIENEEVLRALFGLDWNGEMMVYERKKLARVIDFENPDTFIGRSDGELKWVNYYEYDLDSVFETMEEFYINDLKFTKGGSEEVNFSNMSAGEKALIMRLANILGNVHENSVVLVEEPELFLNPIWQEKLLAILEHFFSKLRCHIILTTHSTHFLKDILESNAVELKVLGQDESLQVYLNIPEQLPLSTSINYYNYILFGIYSPALFVEAFASVSILLDKTYQEMEVFFKEQDGDFISWEVTKNFKKYKIGDEVSEPVILYIRNCLHHPEQTGRSLDDTLLQKGIKDLMELLTRTNKKDT